MKREFYFAAAICLMVPAQAMADEPFAVTPSGSTEAYFPMEVVETSDHLANQCLDLGWTMISSTDTTVVCEVPMSFGSRLLSALAGPSYATPPRQYFRFNMAGVQGYTRVQATAWQEQQTAFGQTQQTELASENFHNGVMGFFQNVGGIFPPNTQFPNHAAIDVEYEYVEEPREGMLIVTAYEGGVFARAGLQTGDIVHRIAGERIKDENDTSDGLHKAIRENSFEVQYYRGGDRHEVSVPTEFREPIGPLPEREFVNGAAQPVQSTTIVQNQLSVAEELARFAELRDQGVLTEEEFQAQKARLLTPD
ncbi:hypothetical protein GCM10023208_21540 [Erythrobacter westpacificensis]|uniref:PDZ domain-containing protein n=2 Tax=Erythrobacter westpacificensis TaxID=1055231 RepID=A0ABP9KGF0_9SPHN